MIDAVQLTKRFKKQTVVDNVSLYVEHGEIVGLLGPNGAGKSTTISMISTLLPPTSGEVRLQQENILAQPQKLRHVLGVVPQEIALYEELTARENLQFFGRIHRLDRQELDVKIDEVLEQIGLADQKKKLVKHFSGGMKRRLNIGASLLHNPQFLIMDEPTVGIDPQSRTYILETVKRLNRERGMSILYTSHYMEEVEFLCDRIYIMDRGQIIASGTKDELKNIVSAEQTVCIRVERPVAALQEALEAEALISTVHSEGKMIKLTVPKGVNLFPVISEIAERTGAQLIGIEVETPTLEDVFLHLTGRALRN